MAPFRPVPPSSSHSSLNFYYSPPRNPSISSSSTTTTVPSSPTFTTFPMVYMEDSSDLLDTTSPSSSSSSSTAQSHLASLFRITHRIDRIIEELRSTTALSMNSPSSSSSSTSPSTSSSYSSSLASLPSSSSFPTSQFMTSSPFHPTSSSSLTTTITTTTTSSSSSSFSSLPQDYTAQRRWMNLWFSLKQRHKSSRPMESMTVADIARLDPYAAEISWEEIMVLKAQEALALQQHSLDHPYEDEDEDEVGIEEDDEEEDEEMEDEWTNALLYHEPNAFLRHEHEHERELLEDVRPSMRSLRTSSATNAFYGTEERPDSSNEPFSIPRLPIRRALGSRCEYMKSIPVSKFSSLKSYVSKSSKYQVGWYWYSTNPSNPRSTNRYFEPIR